MTDITHLLVFIRHEPKRSISIEEYNTRYDSKRTRMGREVIERLKTSNDPVLWRDWFVLMGEVIQVIMMCNDRSLESWTSNACLSCDFAANLGILTVEQAQAAIDEGSAIATKWADGIAP